MKLVSCLLTGDTALFKLLLGEYYLTLLERAALVLLLIIFGPSIVL